MARTVKTGEGPVQIDARRRPDGEDQFTVMVGERELVVRAYTFQDGRLVVSLPDGREIRAAVTPGTTTSWVSLGGETYRVARVDPTAAPQAEGSLEAPMPGKVLELKVSVGDVVEPGDVVLILEAMKMEHALKAPHAGTVVALAAAEGDMVNPGTALATIEP